MGRAMTPAVLALGLLSAGGITRVHGSPTPANTPSQPRTVYLNGPADLEHLRETNFYHYLRAKKILAAANEICRPRWKPSFLARFDGADPQCGYLWMTSLPPKKQLRFHLDGVYYIALVSVSYAAKPVRIESPKR